MTCQSCENPTTGKLFLCRRCHDRLTALLDRAAGTLRTARETLANMGVTPRVGSAGTSAPGIPVNLDMSERLGEYVRLLVEWAVFVNNREEPARLRIFTRPEQAAAYLWQNRNILWQRDYVGHLHQDLIDAERRVLSAADRPLVKRPLGECGALSLAEDNTVTRCAGTILGHETATTGRCDTCHREHDATQRITDRISQAWHTLAPLATVVKALNAAGYPIKYATARQWVRRGKIAARCDTTTRQEGHTPAELLHAMQKTASSTRKTSVCELQKA